MATEKTNIQEKNNSLVTHRQLGNLAERFQAVLEDPNLETKYREILERDPEVQLLVRCKREGIFERSERR